MNTIYKIELRVDDRLYSEFTNEYPSFGTALHDLEGIMRTVENNPVSSWAPRPAGVIVKVTHETVYRTEGGQ